MHKIPDGPDMIFNLFRKRQRLAHQATDPLAQRVVQALDATGLPALLAHRTMPLRRQDTGIGIPEIRVTDGTLAIDRRQRLPQLARGGFVACADCHPNDFSCVAVNGQPDPLFIAFVPSKRPQFVTFNRQPAFFFWREPGPDAVGRRRFR